MPLSRQTSRMVWPSWPVTWRPSTSMLKVGVARGRCGAWTSSRRSAGDGARGAGTAAVRVVRSAMTQAMPPATRSGEQTPAGHVLRVMWSSNSAAKYRIPLVSGFGAVMP